MDSAIHLLSNWGLNGVWTLAVHGLHLLYQNSFLKSDSMKTLFADESQPHKERFFRVAK